MASTYNGQVVSKKIANGRTVWVRGGNTTNTKPDILKTDWLMALVRITLSGTTHTPLTTNRMVRLSDGMFKVLVLGGFTHRELIPITVSPNDGAAHLYFVQRMTVVRTLFFLKALVQMSLWAMEIVK